MTQTESIHNTLKAIFSPLDLSISQLIIDKESKEYEACSFNLGETSVIYRHAKVTPKKVGQFVTLWKRSPEGPITPYESSDNFDLVIISTKDGLNSGQFVFPKKVLSEKGILTHLGKEGKRGFRVYPPWAVTISKQAQKTQQWQIEFFHQADPSEADLDRSRSLYSK